MLSLIETLCFKLSKNKVVSGIRKLDIEWKD